MNSIFTDVENLIEMGYTNEQISQITGYSREEVKDLRDKLKRSKIN